MPVSFMERITQAKSKLQTHMLRRERFWSLPRGGQLATLALAGGWEAAWGNSLHKSGGEKHVGNEAVSVLLLAKQRIRECS